MRHPYQCILYGRDSTDLASEGFVVAACGPRLVSLSLMSNEIISEWSSSGSEAEHAAGEQLGDPEDGERPAKKQKTSNGTSKAPHKSSNVIKLTATPDYRHVVAVTDDKCIRVFEAPEGRLTQISSRPMPKRPCAIQVLPDNDTIISGDKFGDVYSLPLIPATIDDVQPEHRNFEPPPQTPFKPAASTATVHSQRNRQALAAQMNQKNFTPRKETLQFEHKLLLGHVSMLTDVRFLTRDVDGQQRGYILTADRDEHIRVSRGPPHAHIIEGFCLGHKEFVSKICQVGNSELLVSGGGDDWLGIWDWPECKLRKQFNLRNMVKDSADPSAKIAVSGIWSTDIEAGDGVESVIVVACEKVKALYFIAKSALQANPEETGTSPAAHQPASTAIDLPGYPLDVAVAGNTLLVSVDVRGEGDHRLGLITLRKDVCNDPAGPIHASGWDGDVNKFGLKTLNEYAIPDSVHTDKVHTDKDLDELFYTVGNLRKRGPQEPQDADEGANAED